MKYCEAVRCSTDFLLIERASIKCMYISMPVASDTRSFSYIESIIPAPHLFAIRLTLARPLRTLQEGSAEGTGPATEEPRPFARAVFVVEYEEGGRLVHEVISSLDQINGRALKDVQGSLRAYRLTEEVSS